MRKRIENQWWTFEQRKARADCIGAAPEGVERRKSGYRHACSGLRFLGLVFGHEAYADVRLLAFVGQNAANYVTYCQGS